MWHQGGAPGHPVRGTSLGADRADRVASAAFVGVTLLASGNAVAIRFSNRELDWLWGASLRFLLAAAVLVGLMLALRLDWPRGRQLQGALAFGALGLAGTFALTYYALKTIQAGMAQTLLALVPLVTLLIAVAGRQERLTLAALAGSVISAVGVGVVALGPVGQPVPPGSVLAMVGAVACVALATVMVRRSPTVDPVAMNAVAAVTAACLLLAGALVSGQRLAMPRNVSTWAAVVFLAVIGSVVVFSLQLLVLKHWSASRANYVFVLIPLFTIALSSWLDHEPVGLGLVAGGTLVVAGVYLGALRGTWRDRRPTHPATTRP
jgi:drug/metabolite transporter (DMT)-like permease